MGLRHLLIAVLIAACPSEPPDSTPTPEPPTDCPEGYAYASDGLCHLTGPEINPDWDDVWPEGPLPDPKCANPAPPGLVDDLFTHCTSTLQGDARLTTEGEMTDLCAQYDCVAGGIDIGATEGGGGDATGIFSLANLSCLKAARYVWVGANQDLVDASLPNLLGLGGALTFANNPALSSIDLPAMQFVGGDLSIQQNHVLTELELPALLSVYEFMFIVQNELLPTSQAENIRAGLCRESVGGAIAIAGNGPG